LENELVLVRLLKCYGLLSRDGKIHSCNPYVKIELKYNEETSTDKVCGSSTDHSCTIPPTVEQHKATLPNAKKQKFTRSISLQHQYDQFKNNQLKWSAGCGIDKLGLPQTTLLVHEEEDKLDGLSPSHPLSFKHEISTTAQSKVMWHTQNPEFDELFLFHVSKEKLMLTFLLVTVMDKELLTKHTCIGDTTVPLGTLSITGVQCIPPQWFTIKRVS